MDIWEKLRRVWWKVVGPVGEKDTPLDVVLALSNLAAHAPLVQWLLPLVMQSAQKPAQDAAEQEALARDRTTLYPDEILFTLYLRKEITPAEFREQLARKGYSDDKISRIETALWRIPGPDELIRMAVRDVFNPAVRKEYGLDEDYDKIKADFEQWAAKQGISPMWARNHWAAHWVLPGISQVFEMFHRRAKWPSQPPWDGKVFDLEDMKTFLRIADVAMPFRDLLVQIAYTPLTRVDVRRMEDLGVLDDEETKNAYLDLGYSPAMADYMLAFTKALNRSMELRARYSKGWVDGATVQKEFEDIFLAAKFSPEKARAKAEVWFERVVKSEKPERVGKEKDLTKAEIYKGVKKGILTPEQGKGLLMRLGYDEMEAEYLIIINVGALVGSPETPSEFKVWVEQYRKALGLEAKVPPPELVKAEKEYLEAKAELEAATRARLTGAGYQQAVLRASQAEKAYFLLLKKYQEK